MTDKTPDADDQRGTGEEKHATDRRTFLGALGASSLPLGLGSAGTATGLQEGSQTATVPWTETFEVDDGTTDDSGETAWTIENPGTHPDVGVDSNALTLSETDETATWRSESIDISGADTVDLAVTVQGHGEISGPPTDLPAVAGSDPTDPDDDGIHEDLNGNGRMDYDDVVTMFNRKDDPAVADHPRAFDINCNDDIDHADVVTLFDEVGDEDVAGADCDRSSNTLTVAYELDGNRTVVTERTDVASDGETIQATDISGDELVVTVEAETPAPETAYHVAEVGVVQPDESTPDETASSISQYGITWEFAEARPVGQYANGDWWVQGPVTITKITPESTEVDGRVMHGTMVNARGKAQGFDSYDSTAVVKVNKPDKPWDSPSHWYDESLNRDPSRTGEPLELEIGTVFSPISIPDEEIRDDGRPTLQDLALLTVVDEQPAEDAFRPNPYSDGDKTSNWTEDDLDYSILKNLPVVEPMPDMDALVDQALRFWNEQETTWKQRPLHGKNNQPAYGRGIGKRIGQMLLLLHLDIDEEVKRDLFVGLVQYGLDNYGRFEAGSARFKNEVRWKANGGHNAGRKMPVVVAGLALDDSDILTVADRDEDPGRFQEDGQTFFVTEDDVGKNVVDDHETYREADVGMPEWGVNHWRDGSADDRRWGASYRWIGSAFVPHALAAHLTDGAVDAWNHPAFFEYVDRYEERGSPASGQSNSISAFAQACWDEYREPDSDNKASSVSQYGITWEFAEARPVGQYANGDWWVQGPVTITKITPESTEVDGRVMHGTMVNARGSAQGFDSYDSGAKDSPVKFHDESLNRDPSRTGEPLELETGTVFSSISIPDAEIRDDARPTLRDLAVLTVVDEQPAEAAFRPNPYSDGAKTSNWTADNLDYSILRNLDPVDPTPPLEDVKASVERFYNEQNTNWTARPVHARDNQAAYGQDIAYDVGDALLSLHLDYSQAEKRELFVSVVQYGLDVYGRLAASNFEQGEGWVPNGGHNCGRKMPMVLAGLALDDSDIVAAADQEEDPVRFQEDGQTFFVTEEDVGRDVKDGHETYREADIGMPEWGFRHWLRPRGDDRSWGASYRWIGSAFLPHALAAHLTPRAVDAWNHPAFFEYMDRYEKRGVPGEGNDIRDFHQACWDAYRPDTRPGRSEQSRVRAPDSSA